MSWGELLPLAGVVVGSGLTLIGQALTDGRAVRRDQMAADREAAQRLRTDWFVLQRETIIELQESIEVIHGVALQRPAPGQTFRSSVRDAATQATLKIHSRLARLSDRELAADISEWMRGAESELQDLARMEALNVRLGAALRALQADS